MDNRINTSHIERFITSLAGLNVSIREEFVHVKDLTYFTLEILPDGGTEKDRGLRLKELAAQWLQAQGSEHTFAHPVALLLHFGNWCFDNSREIAKAVPQEKHITTKKKEHTWW